MEDPHHSEHTSDYLTVVYDDRIHRIVFRLQTDVILFFIETFYCSRVIDQRNHDLSVIGFLTTLYTNLVTIQNSGIDHRIAADIQHKARILPESEDSFRYFLRQGLAVRLQHCRQPEGSSSLCEQPESCRL